MPEGSVDCLAAGGDTLLWPGRWVFPCMIACFHLCVGGGDGPDLGRCTSGRPAPPAPLRRAEHGQPHVVACLTRGDLS